MKGKFDIIYEDEHIVVVNKYAHVLTIPDRFDPVKPNLRHLLSKKYPSIYVVHRLDAETSGAIIFARTEEVHKALSMMFEQRAVTKEYLAITRSPQIKNGDIDASIIERENQRGTYTTAKKGKKALTSYEVVEEIGPYAVVGLNIYTGRTHQIRVHMQHISAPLLVDSKYGLADAFYLSQIKRVKVARDTEERALLARTSLHAAKLSLAHPVTQESMTFEAPLHKDMKATLFQLRKHYLKDRS